MFKSLKLFLYSDLTAQHIKLEQFQYLAVNLALFLIPFWLGHPQILIGSFVNAMLIYIAINFKGYRLVPAILLPAIAVFAQGMIFGSMTKYLAVFIPFIWVSNFILILSVRGFLYNKKSKFLALVFSSFFKALFLFLIALFFVAVLNFPRLFLLAMGPIQLLTALLGSGLNLSQTALNNTLNNLINSK